MDEWMMLRVRIVPVHGAPDLQNFREDAGSMLDAHLHHDGSQESLGRIRTNVHPAGNLLGIETVQQEFDSLGFSWCEVKHLHDLRKIDPSAVIPFE